MDTNKKLTNIDFALVLAPKATFTSGLYFRIRKLKSYVVTYKKCLVKKENYDVRNFSDEVNSHAIGNQNSKSENEYFKNYYHSIKLSEKKYIFQIKLEGYLKLKEFQRLIQNYFLMKN